MVKQQPSTKPIEDIFNLFCYFRLEHLQSLIDLRQRRDDDQLYFKTRRKSDAQVNSRVVINVGGLRFETLKTTLDRYPQTLLGDQRRRALFYDKIQNEYFFDRHRLCFEAILYYYQSHGRLRRPENVPLDIFLEEINYFDLGCDALQQVREDEDLQLATKVHLPKNRFFRHLWANLEYPQYSMTAKIINIVSILFILVSAVELAVETLPKYRLAHNNRCEQEGDGIERKIYRLYNSLVNCSILGLLIASNNTSTPHLCPANFESPFFIIQWICIVFFTIEFCLRVMSCPSWVEFIRSALNWIDFLAIGKHYLITNCIQS